MTNSNFINRSVPSMPLLNKLGFRAPLFVLDGNDTNGGDPPKELTAEEKKAADEKAAQDKLNAQFAERAERAATAERKKILEELGIKDSEEGKALLKAAKEKADAEKTELEKEQSARKDAEAKAEQAEADAQAKLDAATKKLMDSEIKVSAASTVTDKDGKVIRPAFKKAALADVLLLIDRKEITEDDGSFKNVDKALADLAKAKPWLLEETTTVKPKGNNTEGGRQRSKTGGENQERHSAIRGQF